MTKPFLALALLIFTSTLQSQTINEFNYQNGSAKTVEIKAESLLSGIFHICLYDNSGNFIDSINLLNSTVTFRSETTFLGDVSAVDFYTWANAPMNRPKGGIALTASTDSTVTVKQFICYGFNQGLTAQDGPAAGATAEVIPVSLGNNDPSDWSIQFFDGAWITSMSTFTDFNAYSPPPGEDVFVKKNVGGLGKVIYTPNRYLHLGIGTTTPNTYSRLHLASDVKSGLLAELQGTGTARYGIISAVARDQTYAFAVQDRNQFCFLDNVMNIFTVDGRGHMQSLSLEVPVIRWSDDVFRSEYPLPTLHELDRYIRTVGRLPDVPSEATVRREGIDLAEASAMLLRKLEEAYLYAFQLAEIPVKPPSPISPTSLSASSNKFSHGSNVGSYAIPRKPSSEIFGVCAFEYGTASSAFATNTDINLGLGTSAPDVESRLTIVSDRAKGLVCQVHPNADYGIMTIVSNATTKALVVKNTAGTSDEEVFVVTGAGQVFAKSARVHPNNWADHVFAPSHELMPLSNLEKYLRRERHLPSIPSQEQVLNEGISLGEMSALFLEKIEELTLHEIDLNRRKRRENAPTYSASIAKSVQSPRTKQTALFPAIKSHSGYSAKEDFETLLMNCSDNNVFEQGAGNIIYNNQQFDILGIGTDDRPYDDAGLTVSTLNNANLEIGILVDQFEPADSCYGTIITTDDPTTKALAVIKYDTASPAVGTDVFRVLGSGQIQAKEAIVRANGWCDYVFDPTFELPSLEEIAEHITSHGHLPGIPSEAEVLEHGLDIGSFYTALLEKIEVLTLHLIALDKTIER